MNFDLFLPFRLITGENCVVRSAREFSALGKKCLIVTGRSSAQKSGALADVQSALDSAGVTWEVYDQVEPNPTLLGSLEAGKQARELGADFIVGIGGGSPLDAAKAAAVFATNEMEAMDLYKKNWPNPVLPLVLVGTTAGTGSEVGGASVLTTPDHVKQSFADPRVYPAVAFGDARYTASLSPRQTVSTALDALSHALEGYFSTGATLLTDLFAAEAVSILTRELPLLKDVKSAGDVSPGQRERLYYASVLAGFTLAHCGTCYCHVLGYHLTEQHGTPHGFACAVFLPDFIRRQWKLLPEKAGELARRSGAEAEGLCALVGELCEFALYKEDPAVIRRWAKRAAGSRNGQRTAPDGYRQEEAQELLESLFG